MSAVTHPRLAPRRSNPGATWWSKAVLRAVEESAYTPTELKAGRALARAGVVGGITVDSGRAVAAVSDRDEARTVTITVPTLADAEVAMLVEVVASGAGHVGALIAGQLPHPFVEAVEEAGVELLPYGGELGSACTCDGWLDPCPHALAVLTQLAWLIQTDPFVLTHLRGLPRDDLLARLHARREGAAPGGSDPREDADGVDLDSALEAALRAARLLATAPEKSPIPPFAE